MEGPPTFSGAVLTAGRTSRIGAGKAFVLLDGLPLVSRVESALRAAGAREVIAVGGDPQGLTALGLRFIPDEFPSGGFLGSVVSALQNTTDPIVVVTATDMPFLNDKDVTPLVDALVANDDATVTFSAQHGQLMPLHAAWRVRDLPHVLAAFEAGLPLTTLRHVALELGGGAWSVVLDDPI